MLDSLIVAGNSFQMVGAEKLKDRLLNVCCVNNGILTNIEVFRYTALCCVVC